MRIRIIAVGTKMPDWVEQGYAEYAKRMPRDCVVEMVELSLAQRSKNSDIAKAMEKEGEAMLAAEDIIKQLPKGVGYQWTGMSFQERQAGNQAPMLYALSILVVFLCLAALYESWSVPFAVMLVVPLGILGAVLFALGRGLSDDVYFQVGLLTTIGLASKNAILIVEFAKLLREEGKPRFEATTEACRLRLRPILMTSFAFILGVFPMVVAHGAGAEMRWSLGTAVFSGMLGVTFFGIFLTPVFFYVIEGLGETSFFQNSIVQRWGSSFVGGTVGLILGFLASKVGLGELHWALVGGFTLGALTAVLVQRGRRLRLLARAGSTTEPPPNKVH